tara:strand:+ start:466 stop:843 length:378 start_codon:yes stop_codon:yes gene_type:complete
LSEIRVTTVSDTAGTGPVTLTKQSAAKSHVHFNGTGTVAIQDSLNVSSITDDGTGQYDINFSTNFANTNYTSLIGNFNQSSNTDFGTTMGYGAIYTVSQVAIAHFESGSLTDTARMFSAQHGDLA